MLVQYELVPPRLVARMMFLVANWTRIVATPVAFALLFASIEKCDTWSPWHVVEYVVMPFPIQTNGAFLAPNELAAIITFPY